MDKLRITDDSRKVDSQSIFLQTPQNEKFIENISHNIKIINRDELKKYFNTNIKIIGITGTNGKTTTAAAIYSILLDMNIKTALLGTRGMFINDKRVKPKGLTTPSLLELYRDIDLAIESGCEYFVMEVSSHAIKQDRIYGLTFSAKILTNITSDHLDYHGGLDDYIQTKLFFMKEGDCPKILNLDDKSGASIRYFKNALTYGIESKGNFFINAYSLKNGIYAHATFRLSENQEVCSIESSLLGLFNLYNLMAAILTVKILINKDMESICKLANNFGGVRGRMEIVNNSPLVVVDFAHTADGMKQVFESFKTRNISVVFGAGGDRDKTKRPKMGECAASYANRIYITNDNPRSENPQNIANEILSGIKSSLTFKDNSEYVKIILDRKEAIKTALHELPKDSILLILGKGDEEEQIFSDKKIYFSDRECVREFIESKLSCHSERSE